MSIESTRPIPWQKIRHFTEAAYSSIPLPRIHPDVVSLASIVAATVFIVFMSIDQLGLAWWFFVIHLFLDGADGAIAKRYRIRRNIRERRFGQRVDIVADRVSEFLLFVWPAFAWPWLALAILNIGLAFLSLRFQRALILPIRQVFLLVLTYKLLWP